MWLEIKLNTEFNDLKPTEMSLKFAPLNMI